ncbi:hypothetical protein GALMADRAFT_256096 [Galerina marginata CBS 339.88]|uniref:Cytochrome P450 n=1 Tax=Galerina marginata (strain CBS 339.88) TaxID=685588 RepID=A0A067SGW1_GALM3|nr:hypothetical protein GALMADRAFT_256096 [Galerina marginata CBS 339.88]
MGLTIPKPILHISNLRNKASDTFSNTSSISPTTSTTAICIFVISMFILYTTGTLSAGSSNRPPGPPRRYFGLNKSSAGMPPWKAFTFLQKKYGPVSSLYQGQTLLVVLGTIKAATDLLDKRGSIYSSRPRNIMASELMSGGMRGLSMPYGQRWRNWRSLMHAGMGIEASQGYKSLQSLESTILMHDLLHEMDVKKYAGHLRRFAISVVYSVAYGRRVHTLDDPVVVANFQTDERFITYSTPGKYIVESWPVLLKLPGFLQWFAYEPRRQRAADTQLYLSLLRSVQAQMAVGPDAAPPSTARRALEKHGGAEGTLNDFGLDELETAYALSAPFSAGVGTTLATLDVFFLAMLHNPHAMRRAQAEIDALLGVGAGSQHRLPDFEDAEGLPYVRALIKETMRWRPIAPLGVPHSIIADDTYEGMLIPKGSTVFANIYAMSKDEGMFPSPDEFKPERYLNLDDSSSTDSSPHPSFFFGFGRRICPGMHVAQNSLFIVITRILWAFNVAPIKDASGNPILPSPDDFIGGLVVRPSPFNFVLEPRTDRRDDVRALVDEEWMRAMEQAPMLG